METNRRVAIEAVFSADFADWNPDFPELLANVGAALKAARPMVKGLMIEPDGTLELVLAGRPKDMAPRAFVNIMRARGFQVRAQDVNQVGRRLTRLRWSADHVYKTKRRRLRSAAETRQ